MGMIFFWGGWGVRDRVFMRLVGLQVVAKEVKIYYPLVGKIQKHMNQFHVLIQQNLFNMAHTEVESCQISNYSICQRVPLLA